MAHSTEQSTTSSEKFLRWSARAFALALAVHGLDHLRRGMNASPTDVMIARGVQFVLVAIAFAMTLRGSARAREAAILIGFVSAVLFNYAYVLRTWWHALSDSFVSPPH